MKTNIKTSKSLIKYNCEKCEFNTCNKKDYSRHLSTDKHLFLINPNLKPPKPNFYICNCGKSYKHSSSLCAHKKNCCLKSTSAEANEDTNNQITHKLIMSVLQQNKELQQMLMEQNKTIIELSKNNLITNITNSNNNSNNKTFNLQFFLNETCKDAMNIMDFVDSIKLQLTDLEKVGNFGYVKDISNIIVKGN